MSDEAVLSSDRVFTSFKFNGHNIRFRTSPRLERYTRIVEWDYGYIVVMAKYEGCKEEEEYIEPNYNSDVYYSPSEFQFQGVIWYNGLKWTYYSDYVLEGSGLDIPGRHYDENNYICDSNGYIVLASCDYAKGTILNTPLGKQGKIYDYCPTSGIVDVYVHW